jgi:hypothetical protein
MNAKKNSCDLCNDDFLGNAALQAASMDPI